MILHALLPAGWMPSASGQLVICTGQGPAVVDAASLGHSFDGKPKQAPAGKHDHTCAFSGHSVGAAPPVPRNLAPPILISIAQDLAGLRFIAPGRGLAAPPPPSHAPPTLS
jgi:hypothetical protein